MGLFRLLLAIAVLLQHTQGCAYAMTGGAASVQTFYIISGFLIAMILDAKYDKPGQLWVFYSNRALRIYSTYWLFLLAALFMQLAGHVTVHHSVFDAWRQNAAGLGPVGSWFLVLSNILILGQDLTLFLSLDVHGLHWTTSFWHSAPIVPIFMVIAPAWSLSLELAFYAVAPWILRGRTRWLVTLIVLSLMIRFLLWQAGLRTDPWSYRFFPNELAMFLSGCLSYRQIYLRLRHRLPSLASKLFASAVFPAIILFPLYDRSHGLFFSTAKLLYFLYVICAVPFLFQWTGAFVFDRQLGELSYPFYLCHFNFVQMLNHNSARFGTPSRAILGVVISGCAAYLSVLLLERPLDRFRQSRLRRSQHIADADTNRMRHYAEFPEIDPGKNTLTEPQTDGDSA
jgi:peptidoglycan/LPS O-acetylase OafA/YrhL